MIVKSKSPKEILESLDSVILDKFTFKKHGLVMTINNAVIYNYGIFKIISDRIICTANTQEEYEYIYILTPDFALIKKDQMKYPVYITSNNARCHYTIYHVMYNNGIYKLSNTILVNGAFPSKYDRYEDWDPKKLNYYTYTAEFKKWVIAVFIALKRWNKFIPRMVIMHKILIIWNDYWRETYIDKKNIILVEEAY